MTQSILTVIDCSKITGSLEDVQHTDAFKTFTKELGDSMSGIGFVYFVNHELASETVETLLKNSQQFFELPKDIKRKYRKVNAVENFHGYWDGGDESLDKELANDPLQDLKESIDFYGPDGMDESKYPIEVPGFKAAADAFKESLKDLLKKIFRALAVYLELEDPDSFIKRHSALDDPSIRCHTDYRSTYYIALGSDVEIGPESLRLAAHSDWGTLTFICQDEVGGLEAKHTDGTWIPVTPIPNSVVLNAGFMLEMWSGGHFPATAHRVRLLKEKAGTPRLSLAYFIQPDGNCNCEPVVVEKENWKPLYPKEFIAWRKINFFV